MQAWIVHTTINIYALLRPFASLAFAIAIVVLGPLAAFRKTRGAAGVGLFIVSYIIGATTWFLGAAVTFGSFGWAGLIIGILFLGLGVVPLGIIGAFFSLGISELGVILCVMIVITMAARFAGAACVASADTPRQ